MSEEAAYLIVTCEASDATGLQSALRAGGAQVQSSERRRLDGGQATSWTLVATTAITAAPLIINSLRDFLRRNAIKSISIGDVTIENPRETDIERLLALTGQQPR
jgi:hypothetical protein